MTWKPHELRLFGHRGASECEPENTMESFARALADGATGLEMDVHVTRDGHVVVAHDPDGSRMAGRPELIRECSLNDLGRWNVAERSPLARGRTLQVPRLAEVLEAFPGVPASVDIKPDDPDSADQILDTLRSADAELRVTVGSFHGHLVRRLRRRGYRGPTALTRSEVAVSRFVPGLLGRWLVNGQAAMIPTRHGSVALDRVTFIRRCRRLGLRVDYWVVNEPATARSLVAAGATGIITDDPARIAPVLAELG